MRYLFFPGCSLESTAWDFDRSTRAVCKALGIDLEDIPDWVCCGSTPAHTSNGSLALALPTMNLQKAQAMGAPVMTACASCYSRLRTANYKIQHDPEARERTERITRQPYDGGVAVHHVLDVLVNHVGLEAIRAKVERPLSGVRIACYYGCLLTRPPKIVAYDDPEHPHSMEDILEAVGAEPVDWPYKTECCGASLSITNTAVACRLGHRLLSMAREAGAQCVAVACPLCQANLDLRQVDSKRIHGDFPEISAPYVTQLVGLALGISPDALGLDALTTSPTPLLRQLQRGMRGEEAP